MSPDALLDAEAVADSPTSLPRVVRMVSLGDGYSAGTETVAPRRDSWPAQLAESLERTGMTVVLRNLAEQGATSGVLLTDQLPLVEALQPDVVTLQVGVNDILTDEMDDYRSDMAAILDGLLAIGLAPERIFPITTPDHSLTEWGARYGAAEAEGERVAELNATLRELAAERGIEVISIAQVNSLVTSDPGLVLWREPPVPYGTAKQYAGWAEVIGPYIHRALLGSQP